MARKRMIDPEIWRDRKVISLSNDAFIVWIGIITNTDDEGIIELDANSFYYEFARPELNINKIIKAIEEIKKQRMIIQYGNYAFIPTWFKHQVLNRPSHTKRRRPPKILLDKYPEYIEKWIETFTKYVKKEDGTKEKIIPKYPFHTCSDDSLINQCNISDDSVLIEKKLIKINRKEINRKEINIGDKSPKKKKIISVEDKELYQAIKKSFESKYGDFENYPKEGIHINELIKKAKIRAPDNPEEFIKSLLETFWRLKQGGKEFWKEQPFLPSILNSEKILSRVLEHMKAPEIPEPQEVKH